MSGRSTEVQEPVSFAHPDFGHALGLTLDGLQADLLPEETDVVDVRVGEEGEHGVGHAQTGAEDGREGDGGLDRCADDGADRCFLRSYQASGSELWNDGEVTYVVNLLDSDVPRRLNPDEIC